MVYDLIDYHLRECIKREVKMRVCKNCGRYFALTGRTNTEYCSRPFDEKGRTCREVGAIALWTKRKSRDALFQDYRREYKNRFARMKAGKLEPEELYAWDELAASLVLEALEDELPDEALELELLDVLPEELPDWEPDSEVTPLPMETARLLLLTVEPL